MKLTNVALRVCLIGTFMYAASISAQEADKQKLIEIENTFAANATPGPQAGSVLKQYLYDGPVYQLTGIGRVGTLPKSRVVEFWSKPDPSDPNVKSSQKVSDFRIDLYGDTAVVAYKMTNSDTGHKDPMLNTTDHFGCLDTFVKRNGRWYNVTNAGSPDSPLRQSKWDAMTKAMSQMPKDVQEAFH